MTKEDYELAERHGWDIDCESPFEMSKTVDGVQAGEAKGDAAVALMAYLQSIDPKEYPPFEYTSRYGTVFTAKRTDFAGGVTVLLSKPDLKTDQLISDVAEMIGFHATNIHPGLNGFQGYDCIRWIQATPAQRKGRKR